MRAATRAADLEYLNSPSFNRLLDSPSAYGFLVTGLLLVLAFWNNLNVFQLLSSFIQF